MSVSDNESSYDTSFDSSVQYINEHEYIEPNDKDFYKNVGDLYIECHKKDNDENGGVYFREKLEIFYYNGLGRNYNLCCIRFFIRQVLLDYKPKKSFCSLSTGVVFCEQCSQNIIGDKYMIKTLFDITNEDGDCKECYCITTNQKKTNYSL